jgi:hypothetical protein
MTGNSLGDAANSVVAGQERVQSKLKAARAVMPVNIAAALPVRQDDQAAGIAMLYGLVPRQGPGGVR